jgi:hypothetical protein
LVALAVNVTACPAGVGLVPEVMEIETDGVTVGVTVMVIVLDVALTGLAHDEPELIVQLICCPFVNEPVENVALLLPTALPFNVHW